ncbi:MAG: SufE family protein [Fimbriimonadales bacterium]
MTSRLQETLDDLALLTDRQERIDYLIALAEEFVNPGPDELPRTPENRVPGCESEAYVVAEPMSHGLKFKIAVDNPQGISAMAMAVILDQSLSGEDLAGVRDVPEDIVYRIFGNELSMGKSMGLTGMVRMVRVLSMGRPTSRPGESADKSAHSKPDMNTG